MDKLRSAVSWTGEQNAVTLICSSEGEALA